MRAKRAFPLLESWLSGLRVSLEIAQLRAVPFLWWPWTDSAVGGPTWVSCCSPLAVGDAFKLTSTIWSPPKLQLLLCCSRAQSSEGWSVTREEGAKCRNKSGKSRGLISEGVVHGAAVWIRIRVTDSEQGQKTWAGHRHSWGVARVGADVKPQL